MTGVKFMIVGRPEVIGWLPFVEYATDLAAAGVPVSLSAHGKLGYVLDMMRLNDRLSGTACARDPQRALVLNARGETQMESSVSGDAALFEIGQGDLSFVRLEFS